MPTVSIASTTALNAVNVYLPNTFTTLSAYHLARLGTLLLQVQTFAQVATSLANNVSQPHQLVRPALTDTFTHPHALVTVPQGISKTLRLSNALHAIQNAPNAMVLRPIAYHAKIPTFTTNTNA
jgi:hypothetical protein